MLLVVSTPLPARRVEDVVLEGVRRVERGTVAVGDAGVGLVVVDGVVVDGARRGRIGVQVDLIPAVVLNDVVADDGVAEGELADQDPVAVVVKVVVLDHRLGGGLVGVDAVRVGAARLHLGAEGLVVLHRDAVGVVELDGAGAGAVDDVLFDEAALHVGHVDGVAAVAGVELGDVVSADDDVGVRGPGRAGRRAAGPPVDAPVELLEDDAAERAVLDDVVLDQHVVELRLHRGAGARLDVEHDAAGALGGVPPGLKGDSRRVVGGVAADPDAPRR